MGKNRFYSGTTAIEKPQDGTGVNSKYNKSKAVFRAKKQGGGSVEGKLLRGKVRAKKGFCLNPLDRIFAEGRPR